MPYYYTFEFLFCQQKTEVFNMFCQAFLKMSQKIFKIGPDGFGAYLL